MLLHLPALSPLLFRSSTRYQLPFAFVLLLLVSTGSVSAQSIDSLKQRWRNSCSPEQKIELSLTIATYFIKSNHDSSLYYATVAENLCERIADVNVTAQVRIRKASILLYQGQYEAAQALVIKNLEEPALDSTNLGQTHLTLGNALNYQQNFSDGIAQYLRALAIFEATQDTIDAGKILANIGNVYVRHENFEKAIHYSQRALEYAGTDTLLRLHVLLNLSDAYVGEEAIDKAIVAAHRAEVLAGQVEAPLYLGMVYASLCELYLRQGNLDTAIQYGQQGLAFKEQFHENADLLLNNLGSAWLQRGDYQRAIAYFSKISSTLEDDEKARVLHNFMKAYRGQGDTKQALSYALRYADLKDSIHAKFQQEQVVELTEKYESEKKQQQIDLLNARDELNRSKLRQERLFTGGISIFLLLSVAVGFFWLRGQKTKQALLTATIQHRLLQTQLNPHFLFHALHSIQGFICRNQQQASTLYLSSFSKLMRAILESSDQDFITVAEDAQALSDYLHLQQLNRPEHTYRYQVAIADTLDDQVVVLPPMFTQPFVENALLHGVAELSCGEVNVHYTHDAYALRVTIRDNGPGHEGGARSANGLHRSMSTEILRERITNLKKVHQYHCAIEVNRSPPGTRVVLTFPLRHKEL